MLRTLFSATILAGALAGSAMAQAHPAGMQAAFGKDAGTLSDKITGPASFMSGHRFDRSQG
jgi:hypothetical protein